MTPRLNPLIIRMHLLGDGRRAAPPDKHLIIYLEGVCDFAWALMAVKGVENVQIESTSGALNIISVRRQTIVQSHERC